MQPLEPFCSLVNSIPGTFISSVWFGIAYGFKHYWYFIIPVTICWLFYEKLTRNNHSYNSANGFTPTLNRFVGGGVFYIFNALLNSLLSFLIGNEVDCSLMWINSFYIIPFVFTGLFLHKIGFWPQMRLPAKNTGIGTGRRHRRW